MRREGVRMFRHPSARASATDQTIIPNLVWVFTIPLRKIHVYTYLTWELNSLLHTNTHIHTHKHNFFQHNFNIGWILQEYDSNVHCKKVEFWLIGSLLRIVLPFEKGHHWWGGRPIPYGTFVTGRTHLNWPTSAATAFHTRMQGAHCSGGSPEGFVTKHLWLKHVILILNDLPFISPSYCS